MAQTSLTEAANFSEERYWTMLNLVVETPTQTLSTQLGLNKKEAIVLRDLSTHESVTIQRGKQTGNTYSLSFFQNGQEALKLFVQNVSSGSARKQLILDNKKNPLFTFLHSKSKRGEFQFFDAGDSLIGGLKKQKQKWNLSLLLDDSARDDLIIALCACLIQERFISERIRQASWSAASALVAGVSIPLALKYGKHLLKRTPNIPNNKHFIPPSSQSVSNSPLVKAVAENKTAAPFNPPAPQLTATKAVPTQSKAHSVQLEDVAYKQPGVLLPLSSKTDELKPWRISLLSHLPSPAKVWIDSLQAQKEPAVTAQDVKLPALPEIDSRDELTEFEWKRELENIRKQSDHLQLKLDYKHEHRAKDLKEALRAKFKGSFFTKNKLGIGTFNLSKSRMSSSDLGDFLKIAESATELNDLVVEFTDVSASALASLIKKQRDSLFSLGMSKLTQLQADRYEERRDDEFVPVFESLKEATQLEDLYIGSNQLSDVEWNSLIHALRELKGNLKWLVVKGSNLSSENKDQLIEIFEDSPRILKNLVDTPISE